MTVGVFFCQSVHAEYRNLNIAPNSLRDGCRITIVVTTDASEGEAVPIDWANLERLIRNDHHDEDVDLTVEDEYGSYSEDESCLVFPEVSRTSSEGLEFSAGSEDDSDLDSLLGQRDMMLETSESEILGEEPQDTRTDMGNLALTYLNLDQLHQAEELEVQVSIGEV